MRVVKLVREAHVETAVKRSFRNHTRRERSCFITIAHRTRNCLNDSQNIENIENELQFAHTTTAHAEVCSCWIYSRPYLLFEFQATRINSRLRLT